MFELKLKTDIKHFEAELNRFAKRYIAEQCEPGLLNIQIDETHAMIHNEDDREWRIELERQNKRKAWLTDCEDLFFRVSDIGGEHSLLFEVFPFEEEVRPFIKAFIKRCKELWSAVPVQMIVTSSTELPTIPMQSPDVLHAALTGGQAATTQTKLHDVLKNESTASLNIPISLKGIVPHPLKNRREKVRRLKMEGTSRKEIAQAIKESEDVVKKDLEWLRRNKYLPKS
jgi:hypothetical protein